VLSWRVLPRSSPTSLQPRSSPAHPRLNLLAHTALSAAAPTSRLHSTGPRPIAACDGDQAVGAVLRQEQPPSSTLSTLRPSPPRASAALVQLAVHCSIYFAQPALACLTAVTTPSRPLRTLIVARAAATSRSQHLPPLDETRRATRACPASAPSPPPQLSPDDSIEHEKRRDTRRFARREN
jgi:hypothetical protein